MAKITTSLISSTIILSACGSSTLDPEDFPVDQPVAQQCSQFGSGISQGTVDDSLTPEISGAAASRQLNDVVWVHTDSGDTASVYALSSAGALLATVELIAVDAQDFEDIAIDSQNRLYIADIGDNARQRSSVQIYRFAEPTLSLDGSEETVRLTPEKFTLSYPDTAHNAETLLIDPITENLYILTKINAGDSILFRATAPLKAGSNITLEQVKTFDLKGELATGGDISPNGDWITVRTYNDLYAWNRAEGASIVDAMSADPALWELEQEPQGEAITFLPDGRSYLTISEGESSPIFLYSCNEANTAHL